MVILLPAARDRSRRFRVVRALPVVVAVTLACRAGERPASAVDSGAAAPAAPPPTEFSGGGGFDLELPLRWQGHYRVDSLSTAERGRARPGALNFLYLPSESTLRPQTLAVVALYDSAAWAAVRAEGGPPPGDSVASRGGTVYVVALPQSNPFAPGTADAITFELLLLKPSEVQALVHPK